MHTDNLIVLACQYQLDKTRRLTLGLRAVDLSPGEPHDADVAVLLPGHLRCQTNTGGLWIGKGTPGDHTVVDFFLPNRHECIAYRYPCQVSSHMRKEIAAKHIANRQDVRG